MHSATVLTLLSVGMAAATPMHQLFHKLHKKAVVYDMVTDVVVVTVTDDVSAPTPAPAAPVAPEAVQTVVVTATATAAGANFAAIQQPSSAAKVVQAPASSATAVVQAPASSAAAVVQAPASTAAAPASASPTDYASTAVFNHNQHRSNHSASALAYNATLATWAANTASSCVFQHDMNQGTKNYGQNIAAYGGSGGVPSTTAALANAITDMWYYGEVGLFPFGEASPCTTCGTDFLHFSQAVWKNSQTVGCATQLCADNTVLGSNTPYQSLFTVCNYYPAGNFMGEFNTEVTPSTNSVGTLIANI